MSITIPPVHRNQITIYEPELLICGNLFLVIYAEQSRDKWLDLISMSRHILEIYVPASRDAGIEVDMKPTLDTAASLTV